MSVERKIKIQIERFMDKYPIVALTGPRQSGKTTLLQHLFPNYTYLSLENPDTSAFATSDPKAFLEMYNNQVILDEVQKAPQLFSYLQSVVDESGKMGQYILSGSQNFLLMKSITQSLAGRVILFKLLPFDFNELKSAGWLSESYEDLCLKGNYPSIYDRAIPSDVFYNNYIQTYVERDVSEILNIKDLSQFRKFLMLCATRAGQLLNLSEIAKKVGITQPTAKSWLSVLESSYITFLLQPYYENFSKRIVKTPKLYFYDTGLLTHLLKIKDKEQLAKHQQKGAIFENLIISEKLKQNYHQYLMADHWFWRDSNNKEIDLMIQQGGKFDVYEIKSTSTITQKLFNNLDFFSAVASESINNKFLIYGGDQNQKRSIADVLSWKDC